MKDSHARSWFRIQYVHKPERTSIILLYLSTQHFRKSVVYSAGDTFSCEENVSRSFPVSYNAATFNVNLYCKGVHR